jgi:hypothetical protein|tara:strand:+ start:148 stop:315 length:168 start_codon:yes stop_codon:yes gene_type:complete
MTGAASSVIGQNPSIEENFVYQNALEWADHELITKPNERAKLLAERTAWDTISNP